MIISYAHVLALAGVMFLMGMICTVTRRNLIMMLLGVEVMLNAATVAFIGAALRWHHLDGHAFVLFIFAVAAAEVSVGLAIIVCIHRGSASMDPGDYNTLK